MMQPDYNLSLSHIGIRLLVSLVIGIIIGLEREIQHKAAGLRTSVLICLGSTIFTISSIEFASLSGSVDPSRIAAQIVTGIGFLGAGTIIQTRGSVHGLTTAATIWVMSALGLAVGLGGYWIAVGGAILSVAILYPMQKIEILVKGKKSTCTYTLILTETEPAIKRIMEALQKSPSEIRELKIHREGSHHVVMFNYTDQDELQIRLANQLANTEGVEQITSEACN
jgi:putative Mg2+ transporter-C (MgtC) family protein